MTGATHGKPGRAKTIRPLVPEKGTFQLLKKSGPGQTTILKFLGNGWRQHQVQTSLEILKKQEALDAEKAKADAAARQEAEFKLCSRSNVLGKKTFGFDWIQEQGWCRWGILHPHRLRTERLR